MPRIPFSPTHTSILVSYSLFFFVIGFGDAIMSYFSPVFLEEKLGTPLLMGLVLSTSSMAGFVSDMVLGEWFRNKRFSYFTRGALIGAMIMPLSYLFLPQKTPFFILTMVIWGLYYEFTNFSNFHFMNEYVSGKQHALGWGILQAFKSLAYMISPIVASYLLMQGDRLLLHAVIGIQAVGIIGFTLFIRSLANKPRIKKTKEHPHSFIHLIKTWQLLAGKTWPVLAMLLVMGLLDSTFWTVGAVLSEELKKQDFIGSLILVAYLLPSLCIGLLSARLARPWGKKRIAFTTAFIGGCILVMAGLTNNPRLFVSLIGLSSVFTAITWPELLGTFEDYVTRLGKAGNSMVGLTSSMSSLAYIIGPILAGALAATVGDKPTFSVLGLLMMTTAILCLLLVPRKVHLPQKALEELH